MSTPSYPRTRMSRTVMIGSLSVGLCFALAQPAAAQSAEPFAEGSFNGGIILGSGEFAGDNSVIVGGNLGYYLFDGLRIGLEGDYWIGSDIGVGRLSPSVTYAFWLVPVLTPYAGVFYRHWFVEAPFSDLDTLGVRGGVYYHANPGSYFGIGIAYEAQIEPECPEGADCDYLYPEVVASFSF